MKRINSKLLDKVTFSNLESQYKIIRANCNNKQGVYSFGENLNSNLYDLGIKLKSGNYEFSKYNIFLIKENKYRIIMSENIGDKLVSHFICNFCLKPSLEPKMINQNVATRVGLGGKAGDDLFYKYVNSIGTDKKIYALKMDISKYFYSIPHDKLKVLLKKDIKDPFALDLLFKIINQTDKEYVNNRIEYLKDRERKKISLLNISQDKKENLLKELDKVPIYFNGRGLSIGCVVNQILSVYYLTTVDRYIKEELKCRYYIRYMDDILCLSDDISYLKKISDNIAIKINEMGLTVNPKSGIFVVNNNFTFLGKSYFIKNKKLYIKTKNKTYKKMVRNLKEKKENDFIEYYRSKASYFGLFNEKVLPSIYSEYLLIQNKYKDIPVILEISKDKPFIFNKDNSDYKNFKTKNSDINYVEFLKKCNHSYIFLKRTKIEFHNCSSSIS